MKKTFTLLFLMQVTLLLSVQLMAQVGVGTTTPDASAMLDVTSLDKGLLIPRVKLTGTDDVVTISSPATSLLVYNTFPGGTGSTSVTPGYYYWNSTSWLRLSTASGSVASWLLTGNTGTDTSVNFVGTTDNQPLQFKVNNIKSGYIGALANDGNVFWGYQSGLNNRGYSNIALGSGALFSNITSSNLVAIGDSALYNNTKSFQNTAIGSKALFSNTTGQYNTANGTEALFSNTTGEGNTGNGTQALFSNTTGNYNTANGAVALANTTGSDNTANGAGALGFNTTGSSNTANGFQALLNNTTGNNNTANGDSALYSNITGFSNVAIGTKALAKNTISSNLVAVGDSALFNNTGIQNTAVGSKTLFSNTTGSNNTAIGNAAGVSSGSLTNATAIGNGAIVNASNKVRIGNTTVTVIEGQVAYSFPSDARFKYNIQSNVPGMEFIKKLTPVTYYFDEQKLDDYTKTGIINNSNIKPALYNEAKQLHTGFLAQDVEKIANELGYKFDGVHAPANDKDHYSLAYSQFIMPLVKSVQELSQIIEVQTKRISAQDEQIARLIEKIEALAKSR